MLARTGNMSAVYRAIADQVEPDINQVVRSTATMEAEITEGARADWYFVRTLPGHDLTAMRHLARRRFGVFRAMQQKTRDHLRYEGWEPVFPGHLFVFVWEIDKMVGRVLACPGVTGILCSNGRPMPVDQRDRDGVAFIDKLRSLSFKFETPNARLVHNPQRNPRRARPDKRQRRALDRLQFAVKTSESAKRRLKMGCEIRGIRWDDSTWATISTLEPHERIALLTWTLNAPSLMVGQPA